MNSRSRRSDSSAPTVATTALLPSVLGPSPERAACFRDAAREAVGLTPDGLATLAREVEESLVEIREQFGLGGPDLGPLRTVLDTSFTQATEEVS